MESGAGAEQESHMVPSQTCPPQHLIKQRFALPSLIPKALPPYNLIGALRQRNMAQMKEQSKTPEKELSNEGIANLSDAEVKICNQDDHRNG